MNPLTVQLTPIKQVERYVIDPAAPLDPYFLLDIYGVHQLEAALSIYPLAKLKEGAAAVEAQHPGTKPANRGRKTALIEYIVAQLTA